MSESIKYLIECEKKARQRLEEATLAQESIKEQARLDAEVSIKSFKAEKEAELERMEAETGAYLADLSKELELCYEDAVMKLAKSDADETIDGIVRLVTMREE